MLRVIQTRSFVYIFSLILITCAISLLPHTALAQAVETPWSVGVPSLASTDEGPYPSSECLYAHQEKRKVLVADISSLQDACYSSGKYLNVGIYNNHQVAVSFGSESQMYKVTNMFCGVHPACVYVPGSDMLIARESTGGYYATKLVIYKNFTKRLHRSINTLTLTTEYNLDISDPDYIFTDVDGVTLPVRSMEVSPNGRWLVAEIQGAAIVRIDLNTMDIRKFSNLRTQYGYAPPSLQYGITDDGKHIVMMGSNVDAEIYDVDNTCGKSVTAQDTYTSIYNIEPNICPSFKMSSYDSLFIERFKQGGYPKFNSEGNELTFYAESYDYRVRSEWMTLRAPGYFPPSQLDYLALGDSYSSGEGDMGKKEDGSSYYISPTNDEGGCHMSDRSYPFLLRDYYSSSIKNMHSVACSGAQVVYDYTSPLVTYKGQSGRLENLSDLDRVDRKENALQNYGAGEVPQLEFVKRYKPDIVTLTGGGNDVGFADILAYCATPSWEGAFVDDTCGYSIEGSELEKMLYSSIDSQYASTLRLLDTIKNYSPKTRIILVGYPSFIADGSAVCGLNAGALNGSERDMINKGVAYMNRMLQKAANEKQVNFVDIEDSLKGGRLCEGGEYVTGLHELGLSKVLNDVVAEAFHPNARGHTNIAKKIEASNALKSNFTPATADYTPSSDTTTSLRRQLIASAMILKDSPGLSFSVEPYSFSPNSTVTVTVYSEPTPLGGLVAASDGSLLGTLPLGSIPIGRHVLVSTGRSYSGEPVRYFQFIEIIADTNDNDGDGIANKDDPCDYMVHWYSEQTGEDQCKLMAVVTDEKVTTSSNHETTEMVSSNSISEDAADQVVLGVKDYHADKKLDDHSQPVINDVITLQIPLVFMALLTSGIIGGAYVIKQRKSR